MKIERQQIITLEEKLMEAIRTSDITTLDQMLHDDLLFLAPNGQTITTSMDLAAHRAGHMVVGRIKPTLEEISITGDTAIVVIVYDTKGTMMGNPIEGRFRYVRVWKQVEG